MVPLPREREREEIPGVKKKPIPHLTQAMHNGTEIGMDVSYNIQYFIMVVNILYHNSPFL